MTMDFTAALPFLKEHYTDDMVQNMVYKNNPLFAMVTKMEDFGGSNLPIPTIWGNPQGRSQDFATAQSRGLSTSSQVARFALTRVHDYSTAYISNDALESSKGDINAFVEAATIEMDGAINVLKNSVALGIYKSGFGDRARVGSISTDTITLLSLNDVVNFEVGMSLVASATQGSSVLRAGSAVVTAVDRSAGTITLDAVANITGLTANDYLFAAGDRQNSATPQRLMISGLAAWLPNTAPGSTDNFFGVNRSTDVTRLAGQRYDGTNKPLEETLIDAATIVSREGGELSHYFMSFTKFAELEKSLGAKVQYVNIEVGAVAKVGFRGIEIQGPKGTINCVPDKNCPDDQIYGLQLDMWKLYSIKKAIRLVDSDGLQMLRQTAADGVEVRYAFRGNLGCRAPGYNVAITV